MKFTYIEQETKEKFLRALLADPPLLIEQSHITDLENKNKNLKIILKSKKKTVNDRLNNLIDLGKDNVLKYNKFDKINEESKILLNDNAEMLKEIKILENESFMTNSKDEEQFLNSLDKYDYDSSRGHSVEALREAIENDSILKDKTKKNIIKLENDINKSETILKKLIHEEKIENEHLNEVEQLAKEGIKNKNLHLGVNGGDLSSGGNIRDHSNVGELLSSSVKRRVARERLGDWYLYLNKVIDKLVPKSSVDNLSITEIPLLSNQRQFFKQPASEKEDLIQVNFSCLISRKKHTFDYIITDTYRVLNVKVTPQNDKLLENEIDSIILRSIGEENELISVASKIMMKLD